MYNTLTSVLYTGIYIHVERILSFLHRQMDTEYAPCVFCDNINSCNSHQFIHGQNPAGTHTNKQLLYVVFTAVKLLRLT